MHRKIKFKQTLKFLWFCCFENAIYFITFLVCGTPPKIENGIISNPKDKGTTINYKCNEGYFAHGVNSEKLSTECLGSGNYSRSNESLATCAPIC